MLVCGNSHFKKSVFGPYEKKKPVYEIKKNDPCKVCIGQASFCLIKLPLHPAQLFIGLTVDDHLAVAAP